MSRPAAVSDPDWHEHAVDAIERIAHNQRRVTSEDLRRAIDEPEHANQIGSAFSAAHARKIITPVGYRQSRDKSRRGGVVRIWNLHDSQRDNTCFTH